MKTFTPEEFVNFTRDQLIDIRAQSEHKLTAPEREFIVGFSEADEQAKIDIAICAGLAKYIVQYNDLVKEGKGKITNADEYHVSYHIDLDAIRPWAVSRTRVLTDEQRKEFGDRMRESRKIS